MEKKSKTQLKKDLGKRKHKGTKDKKMSGKKGGSAGRSFNFPSYSLLRKSTITVAYFLDSTQSIS
jgi:hypothetical protein